MSYLGRIKSQVTQFKTIHSSEQTQLGSNMMTIFLSSLAFIEGNSFSTTKLGEFPKTFFTLNLGDIFPSTRKKTIEDQKKFSHSICATFLNLHKIL